MMRPLIRLTLALIVILGVGMVFARAIGGTQPNPVAAWRTNPDGSSCGESCLFGIVPGVTSMDEAVKLIKAHPLTRDMTLNDSGSINSVEQFNSVEQNDLTSTSIVLLPDSQQSVHEVGINWSEWGLAFPHQSSVSFSDLNLVLGFPTEIDLGSSEMGGDTYYLSHKFIVFTVPSCNSMSNDRSPSGIGLVLTTSTNKEYSSNTPVKWRGFASRISYWRIALAQYPDYYTGNSFHCFP